MKTLQLYFSSKMNGRLDVDALQVKNVKVGYVRAVLIDDCDVSHAVARAKPRPGEVFVGAVAIE